MPQSHPAWAGIIHNEKEPAAAKQRKLKNKNICDHTKGLGNYGHHVDAVPSRGGCIRLVSTGPPRNHAETGLDIDSHRPLLENREGCEFGRWHCFPLGIGGKVWATVYGWVSLVFENNVAVIWLVLVPSQKQNTRLITYIAWMIPGIHPRMVKQMLIRRSAPHPRSRKTPRGGRMKAKMILQMSLWRWLACWIVGSDLEATVQRVQS